MRVFHLLILALPLGAQGLNAPCEAISKTLRALEALPPMDDYTVPYEKRIGTLRSLAEQNPDDFFIQRYYQDSFRKQFALGDEFDRALALYRKRNDWLARYYEARVLLYSAPQKATETLDALLRDHPGFVWPHLELAELKSRQMSRENQSPHIQAFAAACPEALIPDTNPAGMVRVTSTGGKLTAPLDQSAEVARRALERRDTPLDLAFWPRLWVTEERTVAPAMMRDRVRADLKRIESWPFIPSMNLRDVYSEASRILNDPGIPSKLKASAERMAPGSRLGLFFAREDWMSKNPRPSLPTPDNESYRQFRKMLDRYEADELDWLRQWPNDYASLRDLWSGVKVRASLGDQGAGSPEDLAVIDALIRFHSASPDTSIEDPPVETVIAQAYVAGKVRLGQVPNLLDAGLRAIEAQKKYEMSEDAEDEVMRIKYPRTRDSREFTRVQTEQIRARYFLAENRVADARAMVERALAGLKTRSGDPRRSTETGVVGWLEILADIEAGEGRSEKALEYYRATLPTIYLSMAVERQPRVAAIKRYYLANGGTEENWAAWAAQTVDLSSLLPPAR